MGGREIYIEFGQVVRKKRRERHLTLDEVAHKVRLTPSFVGNIERGIRNASLETAIRLCQELSISMDELYGLIPLINSRQERAKNLLKIALELCCDAKDN